MVQQKTIKNTKDNCQLAIRYFLNDYARHHVDKVEIDVWCQRGEMWVGHDAPQWRFDYNDWWQCADLVVHCKNFAAVRYLNDRPVKPHFDYFFHDQDDATFTRQGHFWVHPDKTCLDEVSTIPPGSYVVMPSFHKPAKMDPLIIKQAKTWGAVCTDYPEEMDKLLNGTI